MRGERGYTLAELLIGAAIGAFILWGLLAAVARLAIGAAALDTRLVAQSNAARLIERLSSDATGAWAIWAPSPQEIDFFSEDGSHRIFHWSYTYDAAAHAVTRSTGEVLDHIDGFTATNAAVTDLRDPSAPAYDPLLAASYAPAVAYPFAVPAGAIGGNRILMLHTIADGVDRTDRFSSATAPTAFTIVVRYTPSPGPLVTPTPVPLR